MLGSSSLSFETPNVIDPGDLPPSQPSRRKQHQQQQSPSYQTDRQQQSPSSSNQRLLSDVSDLQLAPDASQPYRDSFDQLEEGDNSYASPHQQQQEPDDNSETEVQRFLMNDYEEKKFDNENDDEDNHHSLPAIEEARTYAASLLHSANKTTSRGRSSHDPFARTIPIELPETGFSSSSSVYFTRRGRGASQQPNIDRLHQGSNHQNGFKYFRFCTPRSSKIAGAVMLIILFILLIVAAVLLTSKLDKKDGSQGSNAVPISSSSRLEQTYNFIHKELLTDPDDLMTPGRPQYLAANWIAHLDGLQLDIPVAQNSTEAETQVFVQRFVLAVFYYSTMGSESWINKAGFLSEQNECGWFDPNQNHQVKSDFSDNGQTYALGVTCNNDLQVVNILLPSNGLQGSLPPEIGHLTSLTLLSLPHNKLDGNLPDEMVNLAKLQYLDLKFNFFKGRIPNMFDTLEDLHVLGLSNNFLEEELPPSMASLKKLKTLAVDDNRLVGEMSTVVNSMTALEYLYADRNSFAEQIDDEFLKELTMLKELDLSGNQFSSAPQSVFPQHLLQHQTLQILDFSSNSLQGVLPSALQDNTVLHFLSLRDNGLGGQLYDTGLPMLRGLNHLDIQGNSFETQIPVAMSQLVNLSFLFMGDNPKLTPGPVPSWIFELKQIQELGMSNMRLTNDFPFWMEDLMDLVFLDLSHNELQGGVPPKVFDLPDLKYLMLHNNSLTGEVPNVVAGTEKFEMVTLFDNGFYGDMAALCQDSIELLAVDCGDDITCDQDCCPQCCDRNAANSFCFEEAIPTYLQFFEGLWELNYTRARQSFDPALISDLPETHGDF